MDRIGLFQEMEYVTIKDPFKEAASCKFTNSLSLGRFVT